MTIWATFLTTEVFEPLGLDMVMDPIAAIDDKAVSYQQVDGQWQIADSRWEPPSVPGPSKRLRASWWRGRRNTGSRPSVPRRSMPNDSTLRSTLTKARYFDVYGAGMFEADMGSDIGRVILHTGGWDGFVTSFSVAPAHRVAVAVSCTSPTAGGRLRRTLERRSAHRLDRQQLKPHP